MQRMPREPPCTWSEFVAIDATSLYWTVHSGGGSIMSVPLAGGTPTALTMPQNSPQNIAVGPNTVYWTDATGTVMLLGICQSGLCK
jgi:hypothetical protein